MISLVFILLKQYYIGNEPIDIDGNNLIVGDKEYEGTPGLWELISQMKTCTLEQTLITTLSYYWKPAKQPPRRNQTKVQ